MASQTPTGGHPLLPNIMKLAEHKSKIKQGNQKMQLKLLEAQSHVKKTNADIKKMKAQVETQQATTKTQMQFMKAKNKNTADGLELKKQAHKTERDHHNWKKKTQPRKKKTTRNASPSKTRAKKQA